MGKAVVIGLGRERRVAICLYAGRMGQQLKRILLRPFDRANFACRNLVEELMNEEASQERVMFTAVH